jgi:osmotically-inducible protein OsmY
MDSGSPANDALLTQLVRGALVRRWRGTSGINVSSCSSAVSLHGTVGSAGEREQAENIARMVPGVEGVANRLRVA